MIELQRFKNSDVNDLIPIIESKSFLIQWAGPVFTFPLTAEQLVDHLRAGESIPPKRRFFKALDTASEEAVGYVELDNIDRENGTASVCRVLVPPKHRGRGIAREMLRRILDIGFGEEGLRRIDLRVYAFNTPAISCYEKVGFQREGCLRKAQKVDDELWDVIPMAMLREEWHGSRI